jgi:hypothetical protein
MHSYSPGDTETAGRNAGRIKYEDQLMWPMMEKKILENLKALEMQKSTFNLALASDTSRKVTCLKEMIEESKLSEKRPEILTF